MNHNHLKNKPVKFLNNHYELRDFHYQWSLDLDVLRLQTSSI